MAPRSSRQSARLLITFVLLEGMRTLLKIAAGSLGFLHRVWWMGAEMGLMLLVACLLVSRFAGIPLADIGLRGWSRWSRTEKYFFPQILIITVVVFCLTATAAIRNLWTRHDLWQIAIFVFIPQIVWGFYQEFVYRGIVQTELVRRWGTWPGILISNLVFTFGPLHFYHFGLARHDLSHLWVFAGIFAIGLYFAVLYHRSGNLWIAGILHGVGDFFIDGLNQLAGMRR